MVWQPFITPYAPTGVGGSKEEEEYFLFGFLTSNRYLSCKLKFIEKIKYER
jgi:hypothetical protein